MSVSPMGSVTAAGTTNSTDSSSAFSKALSGSDFMTLLLTQLKNQDPLNPQDQTEFLGQLAQLQTVSELDNVNGSLKLTSALNLLGLQVEGTLPSSSGEEAATVTGTVTHVTPSADGPILTLTDDHGLQYSIAADRVRTISLK